MIPDSIVMAGLALSILGLTISWGRYQTEAKEEQP